jgi:hypothetical protein
MDRFCCWYCSCDCETLVTRMVAFTHVIARHTLVQHSTVTRQPISEGSVDSSMWAVLGHVLRGHAPAFRVCFSFCVIVSGRTHGRTGLGTACVLNDIAWW